MKIKYLLALFVLLISMHTRAQTGRLLKGTVIDSTKQTVIGATVKLVTATDSSTTSTDVNGAFAFPSVKGGSISLTISSIGYNPIRRRIMLDNANTPVVLKPMVLATSNNTLNTVNITAINPVKIKEDTIEFNAAAYPVRDGAMVEDVVKKIPGADVDANGNVTFQGKTVSKVRVNGKDFFGGDIKTATQNLPANAVSNIQMINDYGDQANLTGIKSGEPETVLNINIKPSALHSYFGQVSAGDGSDAIPQVDGTTDKDRYTGSGSFFNFNGDQQISVIGNLNNTNTSLFNFGPPGSAKPANGLVTTRAIGLNYRDSWGKKITVYGSYSFSDNTTNLDTYTQQDNLSINSPTTQLQSSSERDGNINHRFTFNLEYKIDTINYLKFSPSFSYAGTNTDASGSSKLTNDLDSATLSNYNYKTLGYTSAPSFGANLLYNHRFNSHGRNFSVNIGAGRSNSSVYDNPVYTYINTAATAPPDQYIYTNSHTDTIGTSLSYIEPLSKKSYLQGTYVYHRGYTVADKVTDTTATGEQDALLSNDYNFTLVTNRYGLDYRFIDKKFNYTFGVVAQPTSLSGYSPTDQITNNRNLFYFTPDAHFVYNFSRSQTFSVNYSGSTNAPTYSELQPVTDFSNASYPVTGNPDLKPEFNRTLSIRYNKFDFASGNVFFSNLSFTQTDDKIVSNTIDYPSNYTPDSRFSNTIATQYLNTSGYYSASGFYVFGKPWDNRKYNLFFVGNVSYSNNISYLTNVDSSTLVMNSQKNIAKTLVLSQGVRFRVDIKDVIDAEPNINYSINSSRNSVNEPGINDNFRTLAMGITGKNYFWKDWTLSYDYTKTLYYGYNGSTNPNILNTYVERRFLKDNMASLRLSAFDLFNQNTGYTSTITGNYSTQSNVNRLGRYYLLSFIYRFKKTNGKTQIRTGPNGEMMPSGPPPGGGGPGGGGPGGPPG